MPFSILHSVSCLPPIFYFILFLALTACPPQAETFTSPGPWLDVCLSTEAKPLSSISHLSRAHRVVAPRADAMNRLHLRRLAAAGVCGVAAAQVRRRSLASAAPPPPPMLANQERLPRLPLPSLEDTMSRYLQAITPLLTPEQLEMTRAHVHDALAPGSMLRELQRELEAYDATRVASSYVSEAWDRMYLSTRCSLC